MNFVSYCIFGLPLATVLGLVADISTLGLWIGLLVGDILTTGKTAGLQPYTQLIPSTHNVV